MEVDNLNQRGIKNIEHPIMLNLGFDASAGFHKYAFKWSENIIQWFVDDKLIYQTTKNDIPSSPGKIITSLWATKNVTNWSSNYAVENGHAELIIDKISYSNVNLR